MNLYRNDTLEQFNESDNQRNNQRALSNHRRHHPFQQDYFGGLNISLKTKLDRLNVRLKTKLDCLKFRLKVCLDRLDVRLERLDVRLDSQNIDLGGQVAVEQLDLLLREGLGLFFRKAAFCQILTNLWVSKEIASFMQ